jgi:hypothetical protein
MARSRLHVAFGHGLELGLLAADDAPAEAQAVVVPQDVHLIMGDLDGVLEAEASSVDEVVGSLGQVRRRRLGSLVVSRRREGARFLLQAVVYDFDRQPPSNQGAVFEALLAAFEEAKLRGVTRMAVRPLGTAYGALAPAAFLRLLAQVCFSSAELGTSLTTVDLVVVSPEEMARYEGLFEGLVARR